MALAHIEEPPAVACAQPPPRRPVHPHRPLAIPAPPGRAQPAAEDHRPPHGSRYPPPCPARPVLGAVGQRVGAGRPGRQRPRQMSGRHPAPPGQLRLRHRVEQHLTVRTPVVPARVHPAPPCRQIGGLQPVDGRHPVQERPRRLVRNGRHVQDCLHPDRPFRSSPGTAAAAPGGAGTGASSPVPSHGERTPAPAGTGPGRPRPPGDAAAAPRAQRDTPALRPGGPFRHPENPPAAGPGIPPGTIRSPAAAAASRTTEWGPAGRCCCYLAR